MSTDRGVARATISAKWERAPGHPNILLVSGADIWPPANADLPDIAVKQFLSNPAQAASPVHAVFVRPASIAL